MDIKSYLSQSSFIDLLLDAVCVVDRQGRFIFVKVRPASAFSGTRKELIGTYMKLSWCCPLIGRVRCRRLRTSWAASPNSGENRYLHKDGRVVHILWSARWSETWQMRIAVARDITERKHAESRQQALFDISGSPWRRRLDAAVQTCALAHPRQWLPRVTFRSPCGIGRKAR